MEETKIKQCYFCRRWLLPKNIKTIVLDRFPGALPSRTYICAKCEARLFKGLKPDPGKATYKGLSI